MKRRVVKNDDIAGRKLRDERCLHPLQKEIAVAIAVEYDGRKECIAFQSSDQIDALACRTVSWFLRQTARSLERPTVGIGFITVHAGFVYPDTLFFGDTL